MQIPQAKPRKQNCLRQASREQNSVAHFKHVDRENYNNCNTMVGKLDKAIDGAIKVTYEVDFAEKNVEIITSARSVFIEKWDAFMAPIKEMQDNIRKCFQVIADGPKKLGLENSIRYNIMCEKG